MTSKFLFNGFNASPFLGAPVPLPEQIEAAAAAGFDLVAFDRFSLERFEADGGVMSHLLRRLERSGIGCGAITAAAALGDGSDTDTALRKAAAWAESLGVALVQINVVAEPPAQAAALEVACSAVDGKARLAIEYLPFTPLARVGDTVELARNVGFERAGVLIDIWHHERGPDDWDALARVPPEAVAYVEFDDALPLERADLGFETLSRRTFPGDGVFDCRRFADAMRAIGAAGLISIEVLSAAWRGDDFTAFAHTCLAKSRPYWT